MTSSDDDIRVRDPLHAMRNALLRLTLVAAITPMPSAIAQQGFIAAQWSPGQVFLLDANMDPTGSLAIADASNGIASDGSTIWTAHCNGTVRGHDFVGTELYSWPTPSNSCLQGLTYVTPQELAVNRAHFGVIEFRHPVTGALVRSIPTAESAPAIEGIAYDGNYMWQLGSFGIYGTDPSTGAIQVTFPNPGTSCQYAGTGLASQGTSELVVACTAGNWYRISKATGAILSSGNNGVQMFGLSRLGESGVNYCGPANLNSAGLSGEMSLEGSASVAANDLTLIAENLPGHVFAFFLVSATQGFIQNPLNSQGNLCLGGAIGRLVGPGQIVSTGSGSVVSVAVDLTQIATPVGSIAIQPGESWNFQAWHRDTHAGSPSSNFTDGIEVAFH